MAAKEKHVLALEFLTEGRRAQIPSELARKSFSSSSFQASTEKIKTKARPWTQGRGIQGVGIGEKVAGGKQYKRLALRVYVEKKKPNAKVKNKIPKKVAIPVVGEVRTDVVEIGLIEPETFTTKVRPAMPGCGLGHFAVNVGTFGCLVRKRSGESSRFILGNSHVLANFGLARVGDAILQPSRFDGGVQPTDVLAKLAAFQPFAFTATRYPNLIDAAIARVPPSKVNRLIRILGARPSGVSRRIRRGMSVKKVGRTTDLTTGRVMDVDFRLALRYRRPGGGRGRVGFRDQVLCTRFTAAGDSGAAILNRGGRIVGLHFAGSESASIFNRISHVFDAFDIELA